MQCSILTVEMDIIAVIFFLTENTAFLPTIEDTINISTWYYLGPFSIAPREGITGYDPEIIYQEDFEPDPDKAYPSILSNNGIIYWEELKASNAEINITYPEIAWDSLQNYYGVSVLLSATYVYGEIFTTGPKRALAIANGVSSFKINNISYPGDYYKNNVLPTPVLLKPGKNRIIIKVSGFTEHNFSFTLIPASTPLFIIKKDITKPDIQKNKEQSTWLGIPLINTTNQRLDNLMITLAGKDIISSSSKLFSVMPLSVIKIPVSMITREVIDQDSFLINITVSNRAINVRTDCWLKIKGKNEPYKKTFISKIDNSCQYYAVLPPENFSPESTYALIMTCHGASVNALNQVKSYTKKNWAFVVAPTNRRRFGFDWQDWGRLDFLEVLSEVTHNFKIDTNRIYLTGHSMGGHGVWHIGLSHPDLFAAIAPSAGWTNFQLYVPWFLQRSKIFCTPDILRFRDMVLTEDNPLLFLKNAYNLPIYILQGGADSNVPAVQARFFNKYLAALGYEFIYNEIADKKHWWDIDSTPGIDCVDQKNLMVFLKSKKRNPFPEKLIFKTSNISHSNKCYWIIIDELDKLYQEGKIQAEIIKKTSFTEIKIKANNIKRFTLLLQEPLISFGKIKLSINGKTRIFGCREKSQLSFRRVDEQFIWATDKLQTGKQQGFYGPIKQAYFTPFLLVYGTIGDSISTAKNFEQARLQSYAWWYRANGFAPMLPDTEITKALIKKYNLILFGNAATNSVLKWINYRLPIRVEDETVLIDNFKLQQKDLALVELYPNPLAADKFILLYAPSSKKAEDIMGHFTPLYAGAGLPDFIIYDQTVLTKGWAGVRATGFFDKNWQLNNALYTIEP